MATHKSAIKRAKQNLKRNERNRALRSELRTAIKKFRAIAEGKDAKAAAAAYPVVQKTIDKMESKGILHKNTASRYKSRLAAALKKTKAA
ncbi:MAG TPA: 30S ribosomal protein S20 [bacterium]